jgi:hypothetical protein
MRARRSLGERGSFDQHDSVSVAFGREAGPTLSSIERDVDAIVAHAVASAIAMPIIAFEQVPLCRSRVTHSAQGNLRGPVRLLQPILPAVGRGRRSARHPVDREPRIVQGGREKPRSVVGLNAVHHHGRGSGADTRI